MAELRDGDYMKQIISYIQRNIAKGYSMDQLRFTLMQHGYSRAAIERGIRMYEQNRPKVEVQAELPVVVEPVAEPVVEKKGFFSKIFGFFTKDSEENKPAQI